MQATATQPLVVPILGSESTSQLFQSQEGVSYDEIEPEMIQGEFQFKIRPGSTMPHDPNEDLRKEIGLTQALMPFGELINMPQRAIDMLLAAEKDPAKQLLNGERLMSLMQQKAQGMMAAQMMGAQPEMPQIGPTQGGVDANLATLLNKAPERGMQ